MARGCFSDVMAREYRTSVGRRAVWFKETYRDLRVVLEVDPAHATGLAWLSTMFTNTCQVSSTARNTRVESSGARAHVHKTLEKILVQLILL